MVENNDLLDLEQNRKKNLKKTLIYGAVAFLVFIIGVLIFAIYSNNLNEDKNVVLPPEEKEEKFTNFKEIPIEENDSLEIKELIDNEDKQEEIQEDVEEDKKLEENKEIEQKEIIKNEDKLIQKNEINSVKKSEEIQTNTYKKETKKTVKNYYIQVGALMKYKRPNEEFLNLIKKEGYNYRLYETTYTKNKKEIKIIKILVGPFSKEEVTKELIKVKRKISKNAFIYKIDS